MSLAAGTRLGPFEIGARLDLPGIAEVYRARDHEHDRDVAIHVFGTDAGQDASVRERLEQNVRALTRPPLTIHTVGVDAHAVYVVSDLLPVDIVAGPTGRPHVPVSVGRPLTGRRTAAAVLIAIIISGVGVWQWRGSTPAEPAIEEPSRAGVPKGTEGEPSPPALSAAPPEPTPAAPTDEPPPDEPAREPDFSAPPPLPQPVPRARPVPLAPAIQPSAPTAPSASGLEPTSPPNNAVVRSAPPIRDDLDTATILMEASVRAMEFDLPGAL